ncbi:hypothetical protein Snoj_34510 [Streptomyces nojiriensis]|uniref:Uncharacterized protein n=1 Tax=Streptomyces nojiriensis TaxID=66374 RepID=A0ABQ3SN15_9ACTN|nr:hypothetical protein GCM10010205_71420 [Streptomyces nojiriensis]GHI69533.1 hypothetical protein Snoj_34510 [Streptomyces nojiriensis]
MTGWVGAAYESDPYHEVSHMERSTEPEPEGPGPTPEGPDAVPRDPHPAPRRQTAPGRADPGAAFTHRTATGSGTSRLSPDEMTHETKPGCVTLEAGPKSSRAGPVGAVPGDRGSHVSQAR